MTLNQGANQKQIPINLVIDQPPIVVDAATSLSNVIKLMREGQPYVLVMQDASICGVVTAQDIFKLIAAQMELGSAIVSEATIHPIKMLTEDQLNWETIGSQFNAHPIQYLTILNNQNQLVGVVTREKAMAMVKTMAMAHPSPPHSLMEEIVKQHTQELIHQNEQLRKAVSDRQQISDALQESENKFSSIVDIADDAIIAINEQQIIQLFNQGAERIFGYRSSEILGQPLDLLLPEAFRVVHRNHVRDFSEYPSVTRRMGDRNSQVFGLRKNGTKFPAEASISKIKTRTGYFFTVILKDISAQYRSQVALQRSEEQLRLITNALPVLISYIDAEQRYQFTNYAYENWFGIPHQQLKNKSIKDILGTKTYQTLKPHLDQALLGQQVIFEAEFPHQDGKLHWVRISYIPDFEANHVKGCFGLVTDISDHKAAEQLKDDFVSVVSHELRTPLTSVHGSLKLLTTGQLGNLNAQGEELLEIALKNTERLTRLINDVLDLERIESGRVTMAKEQCSSLKLVQQATEAMQAMASEYNVKLINEADPVVVWADPDHVEQTLTNLLSNAIKFSPTGATVYVSAQERDGSVLFKVKDQGRGIPESSLETIFERFKQVDASDSRKRGGTGLGLAICREIVQQHGGRIWVTSIHGQGSTFCFTLPKDNASKL